jgi:hypothetical protein
MAQTKNPLPKSLMQAIDCIAASDMAENDKFRAVILIVTGYGVYSALETIDPTAFAIPESQWQHISGALMSAAQTGEKVNVALSWMNLGPSSYKEED